eukprot:TRINITY_DN1495_c0_g2_i2.p1 TRINITY_DN1495_c0_g2~~TRINITY_DN1495_c0_g2_i2.p1  ORF type:complete len:444 (-),score=98.72 TRINITY_DN1495_c0_g2_i2:128-1405(-)
MAQIKLTQNTDIYLNSDTFQKKEEVTLRELVNESGIVISSSSSATVVGFEWVDRVSTSSDDDEVAEGVRGTYEENMVQYQLLSQEEGEIIQQLSCCEDLKQTLIGLKRIAERKLFELDTVIESVKEEIESAEDVITIITDSEPTFILNKYLSEIKVAVSEECLLKFDDLFVRVHLALTPSNTILKTTTNGVQPILQGRVVIPVKNGIAKFDRLKIMEVSSKYQFQNFTLVFQLETRQNSSAMVVGMPVMSRAFQVLSRNKRKIEHQESSKEPKKKRCRDDSKYVDITALLVLPQKEAAAKLGISESMLCKRFKESTRRKWPYRYLRKIEKTIKKLEENEGHLPPEENTKLEQLREERSSCLQPIKIRVTGRDSVQQFPLKNPYAVSTFNSPMSFPNGNPFGEAESDEEELDSMAQVLQNLKSASY